MYGAPAPHTTTHYLGIDLGQSQDYTALALLEQAVWIPGHEARRATGVEWTHLTGWELFRINSGEPDTHGWMLPSQLTTHRLEAALTWAQKHGRPADPPLAVTHLERLKLGTSYVAVTERVQTLINTPPLTPERTAVIVDQTGVGRGVIDYMDAAGLRVVPISITGGSAITGSAWEGLHVAKVQLIGTTQVLLQTRRLRIAAALPEAATLTRELSNMKVRVTAAANETFDSWRSSVHDDLALSLALAAWFRQHWCQLYDNAYRHRPLVGGEAAIGGAFGIPDLTRSERQTQRSSTR